MTDMKLQEDEIFIQMITMNKKEFLEFLKINGQGKINYFMNKKFESILSEDDKKLVLKLSNELTEIFRNAWINNFEVNLKNNGWSDDDIEGFLRRK